MKHIINLRKIISFTTLMLSAVMLLAIQGCGSDKKTPVEVTKIAAQSGYFTGSILVKEEDDTTPFELTDVQGMINDTRFMFMSADHVVLYDGVITSVTGDAFTGTVDIYKDGSLIPSTTTISGTINSQVSITGQLVGEGLGNGEFTLTYSLNNDASSSKRIDKNWSGPINRPAIVILPSIVGITVDINGALSNFDTSKIPAGSPVSLGCTFSEIDDEIIPVQGISIYRVKVILVNCNDSVYNGEYTGLASTQTIADEALNIAFSNGTYSGNGELIFEVAK